MGDEHLAQPLCRARSSMRPPSPARVIAGTGSDIYSAVVGGIGACAAPSMAGPTRFRSKSSAAYANPGEAEADIRQRVAAKEVIIGFGSSGLHRVRSAATP